MRGLRRLQNVKISSMFVDLYYNSHFRTNYFPLFGGQTGKFVFFPYKNREARFNVVCNTLSGIVFLSSHHISYVWKTPRFITNIFWVFLEQYFYLWEGGRSVEYRYFSGALHLPSPPSFFPSKLVSQGKDFPVPPSLHEGTVTFSPRCQGIDWIYTIKIFKT